MNQSATQNLQLEMGHRHVQSKPTLDAHGCEQWLLKSEEGKILATFDHVCRPDKTGIELAVNPK